MSVLEVGPGERATLIQLIGLDPDPEVPLHRDLILAVRRLGPNASWGARIIALKFVFNWAHVEAGKEFATMKGAYEKRRTRLKTEARLRDPKMAVSWAETLADDDDEVAELRDAYLLAEMAERSMREFLKTLTTALDNHRTDRADQRAGDTAHAHGIGGGA